MAQPARVTAIERETGIAWLQWCTHLDALGAPEMTHKQIALRAEEYMPPSVINSAWWAQAVAVAYTQHLGRRAPGQRQDGSFEFTVTRTVKGNINEVFARWAALAKERDSFAGTTLGDEPTTRATNQWRRWRAVLKDGSRIEIDVSLRSGETVVAATHSKLRSAAHREERRTWWKAFLDEL